MVELLPETETCQTIDYKISSNDCQTVAKKTENCQTIGKQLQKKERVKPLPETETCQTVVEIKSRIKPALHHFRAICSFSIQRIRLLIFTDKSRALLIISNN